MHRFNLDGHKLNYHPKAVSDFLLGKDINPIYVEISPSANCNHRCIFCHYNYLGHRGAFPKGKMASLVKEISKMGVKSLVFAGTGEPLMHPETIPAIRLAKRCGLDVAMSTNGALLKDKDLGVLVKSLTWIRFSFNGGNAENYARIHQTGREDFFKVTGNIKKLKAKKDDLGTAVTIGIQYILLPQNVGHVMEAARLMKRIGVDYFVVKHFYEHPENDFRVKKGWLSAAALNRLKDSAGKMSDTKFSFVVRDEGTLEKRRAYNRCYGLPFIAYIREDGEVYTCFSYQHDRNTSLGNVTGKSFRDLWSSKGRAIGYINSRIDKNKCQPNCRHNQINCYLWELKHPRIEHVNFI